MFDKYLYCLLKCHPPGSKEEDSRSHILNCKLLGSHTQLKIIDMYSNNIEKQAILANMAGKYHIEALTNQVKKAIANVFLSEENIVSVAVLAREFVTAPSLWKISRTSYEDS